MHEYLHVTGALGANILWYNKYKWIWADSGNLKIKII